MGECSVVPPDGPGRVARSDHPLVQLTLTRFREFVREPEALFWVFMFPILLAAGLGLAFRNRPPDVLKIATVTPALASALQHEKLLDVQQLAPSDAQQALRLGKVALVVDSGVGGSVQYRYDSTSPEGRTARMLADRAIQQAAGRVDRVSARDVPVVEMGSRYIDFLVPGLMGMNLMGSAIWGVGFTIVDTRRKKLLKRLIATPMPRYAYLMSFVFSRLLLLVAEIGTLLGFGLLVFHVPARGSLLTLAVVCVLGSLSFTALGLLLASRARTIEAASGLMNLVMLPMCIASGVFFSAQRFPNVLQPIIRILPLTATIDALRANMLQGAGLLSLGPEMVVLSIWLVVSFALAMKLFRWR